MANKEMFRALSSETRRRMLKLLAKREMHVSGLAKELGISVPVAAKHCRLLESAGLLERSKFGKTHVLKAKLERVYDAFDDLSESFSVTLRRGSNVLDALKQISGVRVDKVGAREFVVAIDGEEGYYMYEVNGKAPNVAMDKFVLRSDAKVELKKLVPIKKKEMSIKVK